MIALPQQMTAEQIAECDARFAAGETVWMWCIHHGLRLEPLTEPLSNRIAYINAEKPEHERETRLTWLQPVKDPSRIPAEVVDARKQYVAAWEKYDASLKQYVAAWKKHDAAWTQYDAALEQYVAARTQCDAAREKYVAAWKKYDAALEKYDAGIAALHEEEYPGCPWVDGQLQFPERSLT